MATVNVRQYKNVNEDQDDNVYYNVRIYDGEANAPFAKEAVYSENRVQPIIEKPSDYEICVERFKIPATAIPIFLWDDDNEWYITLTYDGVDVSKQLQFIPNDPTPIINYGLKEAVWSYHHFVEIVNNAFTSAFNDLKALKPLAPQTEAPYMTYTSTIELFTITTQTSYDITGPTPMGISFSYDLFAIFPAWYAEPIYVLPPANPLKYIGLYVTDYKNNTITIGGNPYFQFPQEFRTLALLNDFNTIAFESDSIPVSPEFSAGQKNVVQRILTDFEPLDGVNDHQAFQYYPQGPLRWYDLNSDYPLSRIDLRVYWISKDGTAYPIFVNRKTLLTVKLRFRRKSKKIMEETLRSVDQEEV